MFQMNLVVHHTTNTTILVESTTQYFSLLKSFKTYPKKDTIRPFDNYAGKVIHYKCWSCSNHLIMFWQTPNLGANPRHAISEFIKRYLSFTGDGSITLYLQTLRLALSLQAEFTLETESFYILEVDIILTKHGFEKISFVIRSVVQFMETFMKMSKVEYNKLWKKSIEMAEIKFHFPIEEDLFEFLEYVISSSIHDLFKS